MKDDKTKTEQKKQLEDYWISCISQICVYEGSTDANKLEIYKKAS